MATLDYIKVNEEIQEDFKELVLSQFGDSDNIQSIIEILASEAEEQEQLFVDLAEGFKLENAVGAQLDIIGEFLGVPRDGANDETYRSKLAIAIAGTTLGVTRDGVVEMAKLLSGGVTPEVYLGRFRDVYLYMEQLCFDSAVIGPELGKYFPLNTQGQIIITAGLPFGFEGDDGAAGFGTNGEEDAYLDSGTLSNLVFTSFDSQDALYKYELNSDVVSVIGLGEGYDKPLVNIESYKYFSIEPVDPAQEILYISARQPGGIQDLNKLYNGTGEFTDFETPNRTMFYEVEPVVVQDYEIGVIQHVLTMGSVENGVTAPPEDQLLRTGVILDCEGATPELRIFAVKQNADGTSAQAEVTHTGVSNIEGKRVGIYVNPVTKLLGYTFDGVDQGQFIATSSDDPEVVIGTPIVWSDRRAYQGFFFMEGKRTTDLLQDPSDIIAMRWYNDRSEITGAGSPTDSVDIFGRII